MKVLVFCQRKQSFNVNDSHKVKLVVESLESFIQHHYLDIDTIEEGITFEYLTEGGYKMSHSLFDADYKLLFDMFNPNNNIVSETIDFIISHNEYYDMIILQTCPIMIIIRQFEFLFKTLKKNGKLLITNFSYNREDLNVVKENDIIPFDKYLLNNRFIKNKEKGFVEYKLEP
jgi:hypothetical protein